MKRHISLAFVVFHFSTLACAEIDLSNPIAREIFQRSKGADIKSWMDPQGNPCEDFFTYACGKWQRINSATGAHVYSTDQFQMLSKAQQRKVDLLLNHEKTGDFIADKLRDFYESCRNVRNNRDEYKRGLRSLLQEYGQFSFVAEKNSNEFDTSNHPWWNMVAMLYRTYGKSSIVGLELQEDVKNKSRTMLYLSAPNFPLGDADMYIDVVPDFLQTYFDISPEVVDKLIEKFYILEMLLMKGATEEKSGKTINDLLTLYNTTDLAVKYKDLMDMEKFLQIALNTTQLPEQLYVFDEKYLQHLVKVMASSDSQTLHDYILLNMLEDFIIDAEAGKWDRWCADKTKKYFGKYLDHVMYQQYRSAEYENEIYNLWQEIKDTFRQNLKENKYPWLSAAVRDHALKKLENIKLSINAYGEEDFDTFFRDLIIDPRNYVLNVQNTLKRWEHQRRSSEHKHKPHQNRPHGIDMAELLSFTPVYDTFANEVIIPVALLQPYRLWHPLYPNAIKYSTIGFLLAHEMIHAFDDGGRLFDADGHTHNWWDERSTEEFNRKRRCFQSQYHNYLYNGVQLESSVSQSENIADNAAVKLAFQAYNTWLNKTEGYGQATAETFRNLSYNNKELFFLTMAQMWCDDVHVDYRTSLAQSDVHAPAMYRVIGVLSNFDKFSEVYQCKPGSAMNPLDKCEIY